MSTPENLSSRAYEIFKNVKEGMDPAEELGGPDDYAQLMRAIEEEARQRRRSYNKRPDT